MIPFNIPCFFPYGEDGYSPEIPTIVLSTHQPAQLLKMVSQMNFYSQKLLVRMNIFGDTTQLVLCRYVRLVHPRDFSTNSLKGSIPLSLDLSNLQIDSERLFWICLHQKQLRADEYTNVRDGVSGNDNEIAAKLWRSVILSSSYTGGSWYIQEKIQDALTYVRLFNHSHCFITLTCNYKWKGIKMGLLPGQSPSAHHDITARCFSSQHDLFI